MRSLRWIVAIVLPFAFSSCLDKEPFIDPEIRLDEELLMIDEYVVKNNISVIKDKAGLRYHIDKLGTGGFPPRTDHTVKINYKGRLLTGAQFDEGTNVSGVVSGFIAGFQVALPVFPKGTKATVFIPSGLAYGTQGVGSIPPNSPLVFDIEIVDVVKSAIEQSRLTTDIAAIDKHLTDKSITAEQDTTGVRYVIANEGGGNTPSWFSKVKFTYTGRLLSTNGQFFTGSSQPTDVFDSRVCDFIHGIKVGLSKLKPGGKITVYVPSGLAFGPFENSTSGVPANSNVVYEIELQEVLD